MTNEASQSPPAGDVYDRVADAFSDFPKGKAFGYTSLRGAIVSRAHRLVAAYMADMDRKLKAAESSRRDWAAEAARLDMGFGPPELIQLPTFNGCTDPNPQNCACGCPAVWCAACGEVIDEGEAAWCFNQPSCPWLPLDHQDQEWAVVSWHADCDERGTVPDAARLVRFEVCSCISDDQATLLGPGFSRPVCAVHPEEAEALADDGLCDHCSSPRDLDDSDSCSACLAAVEGGA